MAIVRKLRNILPWWQWAIFFVGYMRSSMLRLAEKRAKRFRNVTRNFACLLLVSRTSQENVSLVIQILTCKWIRMRVYCRQSSATKICYVSIAWLTMMFVEWDKRQISEYTMYINPLSLSVHIHVYCDFWRVAGAQMTQNTLKGSFPCVNTLV